MDKHIAELQSFADELGEQNTLTDVAQWLRAYGRRQGIPNETVEGFILSRRVQAVL